MAKPGKCYRPLHKLTGRPDSKAFAALMRHIREFDGSNHTVVMMQVENEVGVLDDSRDRSDIANAAFNAPGTEGTHRLFGEK